MSAIALEASFLPPKIHRIYYNALKEYKGILWAKTIAGALDYSDQGWASFYYKAAEDSVSTCTCVKCGQVISEGDTEECMFEFESGEPAFYMCQECESLIMRFMQGGGDSDEDVEDDDEDDDDDDEDDDDN